MMQLNNSTLSNSTLTSSTLTSSNGASSLSPEVRTSISNFIGDRIQTAYNMGDLTGTVYGHSELLSSADGNDFYRFQVQSAGLVRLDLTELDGDADLYLLDSGGNILGSSLASGRSDEVITRNLLAGSYYIRVRSFDSLDNIYNLSFYSGAMKQDPGNTFANAHDLGNINYRTCYVNESLSTVDRKDFYRFELTETSEVNLELKNLTGDLELALYNVQGNLIRRSLNSGTNPEFLTQSLAAGVYYLEVSPYLNATSSYTLNYRGSTLPFTGTRTLTGSFGADTFDLAGNYRRTVISGNGNIDFGTGARDRIDLSSFVSSNVTISLASTQGGGSFYDPGNGMRVFDSIRFNDGRYILFEGIDTIQFSDRSITLSIVPNDPKFNEQWSLGMMGVQNAWRLTTGSDKVMVGVTDTGIALTSSNQIPEDLQTFWYNPTNDYQDDFSGQDWGEAKTSHGTLVQSVIAAKSNDEKGMAGINWGSDFYVVDSLGLTLEGGDIGDLTLSEATRRMAQFTAQRGQRLVVNMSLRKIEPEFELAVAANPNVLFVIASGNDGDLYSGLAYPASLAANYDNVIAVGAVWGRKDFYDRPTIPGTRIEYTDWWGSQYGKGLTLMGPSEVVALAATRSASGTMSYDYLNKFNGTSAATPNVTGVASLVWSANPNLSAKQVRQVLSQTAIDLGAAGYDIYNGNGFVNADAAVRRAIAIGAGYA